MSASNKSRQVRDRLVDALRRELMGPTEPDEVIEEYPTSRYLVGRLAPARAADDDTDAEIDPAENDTLAVGGADEEDGGEETVAPLIIGFNPSSFGLSFLVDARSSQPSCACIVGRLSSRKARKRRRNRLAKATS